MNCVRGDGGVYSESRYNPKMIRVGYLLRVATYALQSDLGDIGDRTLTGGGLGC